MNLQPLKDYSFYLDMLAVELPDSSPEIKYCIVKLFQQYSHGGGREYLSRKEITEAIGVTYKLLGESLLYLERTLLVDIDYQTECDSGLPKLGIRYHDPALIQLREKQEKSKARVRKIPPRALPPGTSSPHTHTQLIDHLLDTTSENFHPLRMASRVLLAVLMRYSNECGAVRDMGIADLARLTGMSKSRVITQINRLKALGYIRSTIGGVTGHYLFGRACGALFLNLQQANFGSASKPGITFLLSAISHPLISMEATAITERAQVAFQQWWGLGIQGEWPTFEDMDRIKNQKLECPADMGISGFFRDRSGIGVTEYYQCKLEQYASFILSHKITDALFGHKRDTGLMYTIRREILPNWLLLPHADTITPVLEYHIHAVIETTYDAALAIAKQLYADLHSHFTNDTLLANLHYEILPPFNGKLTLSPYKRAVVCTYKEVRLPSHLIIEGICQPDRSFQYQEVSDIQLSNRHYLEEFGLMTPIKPSRPMPSEIKRLSRPIKTSL